ncbi:ATP-dependent RecD-like DNA helicase [Deltaproteobacteria bacterium TL4]
MMSQEEVTLVGTLERIIYENPEAGFLIGHFLQEKSSTPITIKGTLFNIALHDTLQLKGRWENHKVYGTQFGVTEFMPVLPTSLEGMERYLASDVFKGIGKRTAKRIVKTFGEQTFDIIDNSPEELLKKVPRFNKKHFNAIMAVREDQKGIREVMSFLHGLGISQSYAYKIFNKYGFSAVPLIQTNPYQLTEIQGIGFLIADTIARKIGFDENSIERATAGGLYMLEQLASQGHTCYPRALLVQKTHEELKIDVEVLEKAITQSLNDRFLKKHTGSSSPAKSGNELIARPRYYYAEQRIAENLYRVMSSQAFTSFEHETFLIRKKEAQLNITLDPVQREAIAAALKHKVLIITGGPGTGKTTIIRFILALMHSHIPAIALAAPTGKAAKRLSETTESPASTIHRLLEAGNTGFTKNRENPLDYELLIIDETSMIDTLLMDALLEAIPSSSRLVLVGDVDQLPSVGAGTILLDLIQSKLVPVIRLETVFRQAENSLITVNAHKVRKGQFPNILRSENENLQDFYFIREHDQNRIVDKIITMVTERIPSRFGLDPLMELQVLSPMHRGLTGTINLNQRLQNALNPSTKSLTHRDQLFKVGDKVMQQQNWYEQDVFNGDAGIICEINAETKEIRVEYDQATILYQAGDLDQLLLAYAISVHKSQGSEYPAVILPLTSHHYMMLQRNLVYTALTRGKQLVIIIGTEKALQMAIDNDSPALRYTALNLELDQVWR